MLKVFINILNDSKGKINKGKFKNSYLKNIEEYANEQKKIKKSKIYRPLHYLFYIAVGIALIGWSIILKQPPLRYNIEVIDTITAIGQALVVAPFISYILDLKSMMDYFKRITIEALTSGDYLSKMEKHKLLEMRKLCTEAIHLDGNENPELGLIKVDEEICTLLTEQYYERYRQITNCVIDGEYFIKTHNIEEVLINPFRDPVFFDDFPQTYLDIPTGANHKEFFSVEKFTIKKDDSEEENYFDRLNLQFKENDEMDVHFNTKIIWQEKDKEENKMVVDYHNRLVINKTIKIKIPIKDTLLIKRFKLPTKSFSVNYNFNSNEMKLVGSCFGTLSFSNDGGIKVVHTDSSIYIESFDWLLPGNGFFIAKVNK